MNSVYDVIEVLRVWHGLTMKELAARASVSYTTLATFMNKRPDKMAKNTLTQIAGVFRAEWYELLMVDSPSGPVEPYRGRNLNGERVNTKMDEAAVESVLRCILGDHYEEAIEKRERLEMVMRKNREKRMLQEWNCKDLLNHEDSTRSRLRAQCSTCIELAFDNLNDDGVIEAMRYILELAQNPKYKKTSEQEKMEDTE